MNKIIKAFALTAIAVITLANSGCNDKDVASSNLSQEADNFRVARRVVFMNGITDNYMLEVKGFCAIEASTSSRGIAVICKTSEGHKKHILGLSDNVTYFVEQLEPKNVNTNFYQVTFKPTVILPDFRNEIK